MADTKNVHLATDANFDSDVLKSSQLAMVDFWAEWCGPCKMLGPTIDSLATQYDGKMKVYKMNVDENPTVPSRFNIRGIPTVILFKNGQVVDQIVGNRPKGDFEEAIARHL
jgi:thioredoxin 1